MKKNVYIWTAALLATVVLGAAPAVAEPIASVYVGVSVSVNDTSVERCQAVVVTDDPDAQVSETCPPPYEP